MDNITNHNISGANVLMINEFYYAVESKVKLPKNFFSKIVEYENMIFINEEYDQVGIQELASLYKVYLS